MERFTFRPLTLSDIAAVVGKPSIDLRLIENEDGTVEIETPTLTATKRSQLRVLFTNRGFVEITG